MRTPTPQSDDIKKAGEHTLAAWSHHDAHLHPLTNVPTKCQPSGIQEIAETRF